MHCNKIISTIIRSRETDTNNGEDSKRLDTLPRRIIGVCASYLDQMSYAALSVTNRSSYLGCNGPNTLNEVNLQHRHGSVDVYSDFSAFPFATKLLVPAIGSLDEMRNIASQISKLPRLHSLNLSRSGRNLIRLITNDDVINERITPLFSPMKAMKPLTWILRGRSGDANDLFS